MPTPYYSDPWATLYLANSSEEDIWTDADVLVTDPPYGIAWEGVANYSKDAAPGRKTRGNDNPIANDETLEIRDRILEMWGDRPAIVFGTWRMPRPAGTRHRLVWWKRGQAPGPTRNAFVTQDEEIYILGGGWPSSKSPMRSVIPTTEQRSREVSTIGHPTPKPVALMEQLIERCPEGVIADPFAGSGSTLLAARNLGRQAIGVELEERYCEIIAKRLASTPPPLTIDTAAAAPTVPAAFDLGF